MKLVEYDRTPSGRIIGGRDEDGNQYVLTNGGWQSLDPLPEAPEIPVQQNLGYVRENIKSFRTDGTD